MPRVLLISSTQPVLSGTRSTVMALEPPLPLPDPPLPLWFDPPVPEPLDAEEQATVVAAAVSDISRASVWVVVFISRPRILRWWSERDGRPETHETRGRSR